MSLYNADGQVRTTQVGGSSYTGLDATDGSWNIVINDGTSIKGLYHPCGALNAVIVTDSSAGYYSKNGSMNVIANTTGGYSPVVPRGDGATQSFIPAQGWGSVNRLRGTYPFISGSYTNNLSNWESWLGGTADFVLAYATGPDWTTLLGNVDAQITSLIPSNKVTHWSVGIPANKTLTNVTAGTEDSNFISIANKIVAARPSDPFYVIRPLWEAQNISIGSWYAVGQEATYINAFKRITQLFLGVSLKFRIDWTMNETTTILGTPYDPTQLYPGNSYVDLIGQDFYWINAFSGTDPVAAWRLKQADTYGLNFIANFAKINNKPLALGEWGVNYDGPQYISLMLEYCALNNVALQAYFNADNGGNFNNRLDLNQYPQVTTRFRQEFATATSITNILSNGTVFTTAPWSGVGNGVGSITAGQSDPFGGTAGATLLETATTSQHYIQASSQTVSSTPGLFRMFSFAKPQNGRNFMRYNVGQATFAEGIISYYDLLNQTPGSSYVYGGPRNLNVGAIPELNGYTKTAMEWITDGTTDMQPLVQIASDSGSIDPPSYLGDITKGINLYNVILRRVGDVYLAPLASGTGVFACFSLRQVIQNYAGPLIRITRASDSTFKDFYPLPSDGSLDMTAVAAFLSATSTSAVTWYDQSGNGRHVVQGTAANCPTITASQYGTRPGFVFTSVQQLTKASVPWTTADMQVYAVARTFTGTTVYRTVFALGNTATAGVTNQLMVGGASQDWLANDAIIAGAGTNTGLSPRAIVTTPAYNDNANHQSDYTLAAAGNDWFKDGVSQTLRVTSAGSVPAVTGTLSVSFSGASISGASTGSIAELIILNTTSPSSPRATIRAGQKAYWGTP